jgi:phage tail-like protein
MAVAVPYTDPLTNLRFDVKIDGEDLGMFTACEGLGAQIEMEEYREGGQNGFVYKLPGRLSYTPITLTRAIEAKGSLAPWFTGYLKNPGGGKTGAITAYDGTGKQVAQWNLVDVYPSRWTGPSFGLEGPGVAHETLELTHNGFSSAGG